MPGTQKTTSKTTVLWIINLVTFAVALINSGVNVALPTIGSAFNMDAIVLSWVVSSHLLTNTIAVLPFGRVADICGRRKIFSVGVVTYTLLSFLSAVAWSSPVLVLFRALHGISAAITLGVGMAIITSAFPANERGKALGINVAVVYAGLSSGPLIGGFLTQALGWRSIFYINGVLMVIAMAWSFWKLRDEWADARGESMDYTGSIIYMLALVGIMYGFSTLPSLQSCLLIGSGIIAMIIFYFWEQRTRYPVLNVKLLRGNVVFSFSNLAALLTYSATFGVGFFISLYLQYIKGYSPTTAGLVLVMQPAIMAIISPAAGTLSDRVDARIVASTGLAILTLGIAMLIFIDGNTSLVYVIMGQIIMGVGFALFSSPNTNSIMGSVEKRYYGVATGTLATMRTLGQTFSLAVVTLLFALLIGRQQINPANFLQFQQSMKIAFIIFAVLCFLGIFASLARGRKQKPMAVDT